MYLAMFKCVYQQYGYSSKVSRLVKFEVFALIY